MTTYANLKSENDDFTIAKNKNPSKINNELLSQENRIHTSISNLSSTRYKQ